MDFDRHFNLLRRQVDRMFDDFNTQLYSGMAMPTTLPLLLDDTTQLLAPPLRAGPLPPQQQQQQLQQQQQAAGGKQVSTAAGQSSALTPFGGALSSGFGMQPLKVDVVQEKDAYVVFAEVPGVNKEELKVQVKDDVLTISGERKHEVRDEDPSHKYVRLERTYGNFSRSLRLPQGCDTHNVSAAHENGVLKVSIPFRPELKEEKHIAIA